MNDFDSHSDSHDFLLSGFYNEDTLGNTFKIGLVMPFMWKGSLKGICYGKSSEISLRCKVKWCYQLAKGIKTHFK